MPATADTISIPYANAIGLETLTGIVHVFPGNDANPSEMLSAIQYNSDGSFDGSTFITPMQDDVDNVVELSFPAPFILTGTQTLHANYSGYSNDSSYTGYASLILDLYANGKLVKNLYTNTQISGTDSADVSVTFDGTDVKDTGTMTIRVNLRRTQDASGSYTNVFLKALAIDLAIAAVDPQQLSSALSTQQIDNLLPIMRLSVVADNLVADSIVAEILWDRRVLGGLTVPVVLQVVDIVWMLPLLHVLLADIAPIYAIPVPHWPVIIGAGSALPDTKSRIVEMPSGPTVAHMTLAR